MKKKIALLLVAIVLSMTSNPNTFAISDNQKSIISQGCASIKQSLRSLQKADSKVRSHLGSVYTLALNDYIAPLNMRLVRENKPDSLLTDLHATISEAKEDFAQKFTVYSQNFEELLTIDCQANPGDFYSKLETTRSKRKELFESAQEINGYLKKHIGAVRDLEESL